MYPPGTPIEVYSPQSNQWLGDFIFLCETPTGCIIQCKTHGQTMFGDVNPYHIRPATRPLLPATVPLVSGFKSVRAYIGHNIEHAHAGASVWRTIAGIQIVLGPDWQTNGKRDGKAQPLHATNRRNANKMYAALQRWQSRQPTPSSSRLLLPASCPPASAPLKQTRLPGF